jgi:cytochrome c oxidase cbb3-type subunit 3
MGIFNAGGYLLCAALICSPLPVLAQQHQPTPLPRQQPVEDQAAVGRGATLFKSSCGFCHGNDATGARAPDLLRSAIVVHDDHGNLLGPFIRNGRPDKGMPSFTTMKDDEIADIVAFLHNQQIESLHSNRVRRDYPLARLLTGNAQAGKAFFDGAGECSRCHSLTGDLAGIANKYSPIDLQQHMVYPGSRKKSVKTAVVTLKDGARFEGAVVDEDDFNIGITCQDGWYRSWPLADVTVEIHDPFEAHRELMNKYTDAEMHNLFAYLETLK